MSLLEQAREIKKGILSEQPNTARIIRQIYSLNKQIGKEISWINYEHKGYYGVNFANIPKYRVTSLMTGINSADLSPHYTPYYIREPISTIQSLSKTGLVVKIPSTNPILMNRVIEKEINAEVFRHIINVVNINSQDYIEDIISELVKSSNQNNDILNIKSLIKENLRKIIKKLPNNENEVNNYLETIFIVSGYDDQFEREKITIPYSSKSYKPDFVFKNLNLVVEGKYCRLERREKEIISEINEYITAFKTDYENIIFVVYDNGVINDVDKFKKDIENKENVSVLVIKH